MRTSLAPIALTALLAGGAGALAFGPAFAGAQTDDAPAAADARPGPLADALADLVEDGTLTQAQADAVAERLRDAWPHRGGHHPWIRATGEELLELLGLTGAELRDALSSGQTLADVAESQGTSVDDLVDVLVAAGTEAIDEAVADGRLSEERAAEIKANLEERTRERVEDGAPARRFDGRRGGHRSIARDEADADSTRA